MRTLNPVWNHTSIYKNIHREELKNKTLELAVWDWDRFTSNDYLGVVNIDLSGKLFKTTLRKEIKFSFTFPSQDQSEEIRIFLIFN